MLRKNKCNKLYREVVINNYGFWIDKIESSYNIGSESDNIKNNKHISYLKRYVH